MNYSLEIIDTVQGCNTLLVQAQLKKQKLEHKRSNLGDKIDIYRKRMDQIDQQIVLTQTSLAAFTAASMAMPEGKDKMNMIIKVKRLELQQVVLNKKAGSYGVKTWLAKQLEYARLEGQVSVVEQYIIDIETRIATLGQPVLSVSRALAVSPVVADTPAKNTKVVSDDAAWVGAYLDAVEVFLRMLDGRDDLVKKRQEGLVIELIDDGLTNTFVQPESGRSPKPPRAARRKQRSKPRP